MGFTDAFVVSFKDGQRTLLPSGGNQLKGKASKPKNEKEADQFVAKKKLVNPTVIKFKIQIALFKTSAPEDEISRFVKLAGEYGLSDFLDINGNTLYTIGEFDDYEEALRVRVELMEQGASDSFIVAFKGYEKIPVSEAIRLINNR